MNDPLNRRKFLKHTGAGALAISTFHIARSAQSPSDKLVAGVMGLGRGMGHVEALLGLQNAEIAYLCDTDQQRIDQALKSVSKKQERTPKGLQDFRRMLEDKNLDAIFI